VRFIDNTGVPIREQHYEKITLVDGRAFPTVVRLRDIASSSETTITFGDVHFGRRIPPSYFDLSVMNERLRRGVDPVPEPPDLRDETPPVK
jgi:outer membrane lipoprotein-sorting protein